jgi:hypothetical protein
MSYPINYPTPQGANIQIFTSATALQSWVKPQGASFVWFTLIGAGGGGGSTDGNTDGGGGGSGAVTNCMVPAFLIPDELVTYVGNGGKGGVGSTASADGELSQITYTQSYSLLTAQGGKGGVNGVSGGTGGAGAITSASNNFSCMGFYQSIAGQAGANQGSSSTASSFTFLSGGGTGGVSANYGYNSGTAAVNDGIFQIQPIIVGVGGGCNISAPVKGNNGGVGCGGGGGLSGASTFPGGKGGNGLIVIITW